MIQAGFIVLALSVLCRLAQAFTPKHIRDVLAWAEFGLILWLCILLSVELALILFS